MLTFDCDADYHIVMICGPIKTQYGAGSGSCALRKPIADHNDHSLHTLGPLP